MDKQRLISIEYLKSILDYDPLTGDFLWKSSNKKAGGSNGRGYRVIGIGGKLYYAHRLAWFYTYGVWPLKGLDHANRDTKDNRISNLREADQSQNISNTVARGRSGLKGAYWHSQRKKWYSTIGFSGKIYHLGTFNSKEDAHAAWASAAVMYQGSYARIE